MLPYAVWQLLRPTSVNNLSETNPKQGRNNADAKLFFTDVLSRFRIYPRGPHSERTAEKKAETTPKQAVFEDVLSRVATSASHGCKGPVRNKGETRPKQGRRILFLSQCPKPFPHFSFRPSFREQGRNKAETIPKQAVFEDALGRLAIWSWRPFS